MSDENETVTETAPEAPQTITIKGKQYTLAEIENLVSGKVNAPAAILPDDVAPPGKMLLARCFVKMSKVGSNVELRDVTPAEAMLLTAIHQHNAGSCPISDLRYEVEHEKETVLAVKEDGSKIPVAKQLVPTGEQRFAIRSANDERNRLVAKYGKDKVKALFPGGIPQLPANFREAVAIGGGAELPTGAMIEHDISKK